VSEDRKYLVNDSQKRMHYYPPWEECNIDDAGTDTRILTQRQIDTSDMTNYVMCQHCATKPR